MTTTPTTAWPPYQRILFRYAFAFWGLILLQLVSPILQLERLVWNPLTNLAAKILGWGDELTTQGNGSGDILFNWLLMGVTIGLAVLLGSIFNLIDRKRENYDRWSVWLDYLLSVYLGIILLVYGIMKVFPSQFPPLSLSQLSETFGGSSPMRILWTFMGASQGYSIFAGFCEVIPAVLLFLRPTRTLGALMSFGVMLNVFVLNVFYDVPVKLFSFQLLVISAYLIIPDAKRLWQFLVLNRAVAPAKHTSLLKNEKAVVVVYALQFILVLAVGLFMANTALNNMRSYGALRPQSALYGIHKVEVFESNGQIVPPLANDGKRWKQLIFDDTASVRIIYQDDQRQYLPARIDTVLQEIQFPADTLQYTRTGKQLHLTGQFASDTLSVYLNEYDLNQIPLKRRNFRWVNSFPDNRYEPW